jgi:hypothetical protein
MHAHTTPARSTLLARSLFLSLPLASPPKNEQKGGGEVNRTSNITNTESKYLKIENYKQKKKKIHHTNTESTFRLAGLACLRT